MQIKITTDKSHLNFDYVHHYISQLSYWAKGIPAETLKIAIANSLCFIVLKEDRQIGFARAVSDFATFAYIADLFIDEAERGKGYSKQLMQSIMEHPQLQKLRRMLLMTLDAHGLYQQFGFTELARPERAMEKVMAKPYP